MPHLQHRPEKLAGEPIQIRRAFYIKLGRGGEWEADSLARNIMRIGWPNNSLEDINSGNWDAIEHRLRCDQPHQGTATRDVNALRDIVASTEEDIWITFHGSRLWWCRLAPSPVQADEISKFRRVAGAWSDCDASGRVLMTSDIPGLISQLQGFRGTVCAVRASEGLRRMLNAEPSSPYQAVTHAREVLIQEVGAALGELHWKDFETLVDLLFRQAGWRRLSVLGETMKYADLELEEPVTGDRYQVQIKSAANAPDFAKYRDRFAGRGFRKVFFVVHSPTAGLAREISTPEVELVLPARLAAMIVDAGLVSWILAKIR
jgi:restriction endonuclease